MDLSDRKLKTTVTVMFKKLKETMFREERKFDNSDPSNREYPPKVSLFFHGNLKVGKYIK